MIPIHLKHSQNQVAHLTVSENHLSFAHGLK